MKKKKNSWKKITINLVRTTPRSTGEFSEFSQKKKGGGEGGGVIFSHKKGGVRKDWGDCFKKVGINYFDTN